MLTHHSERFIAQRSQQQPAYSTPECSATEMRQFLRTSSGWAFPPAQCSGREVLTLAGHPNEGRRQPMVVGSTGNERRGVQNRPHLYLPSTRRSNSLRARNAGRARRRSLSWADYETDFLISAGASYGALGLPLRPCWPKSLKYCEGVNTPLNTSAVLSRSIADRKGVSLCALLDRPSSPRPDQRRANCRARINYDGDILLLMWHRPVMTFWTDVKRPTGQSDVDTVRLMTKRLITAIDGFLHCLQSKL